MNKETRKQIVNDTIRQISRKYLFKIKELEEQNIKIFNEYKEQFKLK